MSSDDVNPFGSDEALFESLEEAKGDQEPVQLEAVVVQETEKSSVLVIDDEDVSGGTLVRSLGNLGYAAKHVKTIEDALKELANDSYFAVISDIWMPDEQPSRQTGGKAEELGGMIAKNKILEKYEIPFIIYSGYPGVKDGIADLRRTDVRIMGAFEKPLGTDALKQLDSILQISKGVCLLLQEREDKKRIEFQLELHALVHNAFLPSSFPSLEGYELDARWQAAHNERSGGDYLDWSDLGNGRYGIFLGDIEGHGIGSSSCVAMLGGARSIYNHAINELERIIRDQLAVHLSQIEGPDSEVKRGIDESLEKIRLHPNELVATLERAVLEYACRGGLPLTGIYGVLDINNHTFRYCNFGHEAPLIS